MCSLGGSIVINTATNTIDIGSQTYPELSNLEPYVFIFRDVECGSMEGLLQALKFANPETQGRVVKLSGIKAKRKGQKKKWWLTKILYWNGEPILRHSEEYQQLITEAYHCLVTQNSMFRRELINTIGLSLTHSIGKSDPNFTILTEQEFIGQLIHLRNKFVK